MDSNTNFGEHFMIDGYGGNKNKLNDKNLVLRCLTELPQKLGMRTLSVPEVFLAEDNGTKDPGGWSGYVVIVESHISVHTFPNRGFVSIDVYSCKNGLDTTLVSNYFKEVFELKDLETNFVKRGTRYPKENIY